MDLPSAWNRTTLVVASAAYAGMLLVTGVETPPTAGMLVGVMFVFALSAGGTVRFTDEQELRLPAVAFFGTVALLLAAAWWRGTGDVDALVAASIHLFGLFVVAAVSTAELFLQQVTGARDT